MQASKIIKSSKGREYYLVIEHCYDDNRFNLIVAKPDEVRMEGYSSIYFKHTESVAVMREVYNNNYIAFIKGLINNYERDVVEPMKVLMQWDGDCSD